MCWSAFGRPGGAPCRRTEPIIDELAAEHGDKIKFVKFDADANIETVTKYGVVSIPTFNLYAGGEVIKSLIGADQEAVPRRARRLGMRVSG
ncbi:thioredoxin family protein [Georgenia daeguensis]|uniref:thioredoxin family protein n=1 Tax=Georgenia daeguensis TaxID=908355 RepID=UPI0031E61864